MSKAHTDRARYLFKTAESTGQVCFVMTEPYHGTLPILETTNAFLSFDLKNPTIESAQEVAKFLNEHVEAIACTMFER